MRQLGAVPALAGLLAPILLLAPLARPDEPPALVALVLDTSGSVAREGLAGARRLADELLRHLAPDSEVAVFTFDDDSRLLLPRTAQPEAVRRALSAVQVAGKKTALHDALYDASRYLRDSGAPRRAIVLLTDGRDENSALNLDDGLRLAQEGGIPVYAVGVGRVDEKVLRRIAKLTGGEYAPLAQARPERLAARLQVGPARPASAAAGPAARGSRKQPATPQAERGLAPASPGGRRWLLWAAGLALVLAGLGILLSRRRSVPPRCPTCGRPLPDRLSSCPSCAPAAPPASGSRPATFVAELSPTVLARLNVTEEYLDKTVTLQERPVLHVTRGSGAGRSFDLKRESAISVGRARANDIVLDDEAVSSQHCRIRLEDGAFVLHDLRSHNGTFVNDRRISSHPLAEGDVIQVGETYMQFKKEHRREQGGR